MGLDMFAMITTEEPTSDVDFKIENAGELHYWRKHPNLHGWMEQLYFKKGGSKTFNCTPVRLTKDNLDDLDRAIQHNALPPTQGFFFGQSDGSEREDDLLFIEKARKAILDGYIVYYDSWW